VQSAVAICMRNKSFRGVGRAAHVIHLCGFEKGRYSTLFGVCLQATFEAYVVNDLEVYGSKEMRQKVKQGRWR